MSVHIETPEKINIAGCPASVALYCALTQQRAAASGWTQSGDADFVIGGLVSVTRPSPALTEIVTRTQLGALLRHALTLDTTWGAPWALHALTCLLQDILEGERLYGSVVMNTEQHREEVENFDIAMDGARAAAAAAAAIPSTSGTTSAAAAAVAGPSGAAAGQSGSSGPAGPTGNGVAPTVNGTYTTLEEEDIPGKYSFLDLEDSSESEDMIGEYLADMPAFVGGASNNSITSFELAVSNGKDSRIGDLVAGPLASSHPGMDHSTAVDARLEAGVSLLSELRLHMMAAVHTSRLSLAVTAPLKVNNGMWGDTEVCGPGDLTGSVELLTDVFQKILLHLSMQFDGSHVESVLGVAQHQLGACRGQVRSLCCPNCAPNTKSHLSTLGCSCQKWKRQHAVLVSCAADAYTLLQLYATGTHAPHPTSADQYDHVDLTGMSMNIVTDTNFVPALQKLLTGSCATGSDMRSDVVGSTVTGLLEDLLVRLRVRCDVISVTSGPGTTLKHALLSLVARLLEPQGAISLAMGPLDAQCCLLGTLLSMHYDGLDRMHVLLL
nr:uncharacterized protein LOC113820709 [Penaeus vannamei]